MTDESARIGAIILPDEGGIRPTFYVLRDGNLEYDEAGVMKSADWGVFEEHLYIVRGVYAERTTGSALVGAAVRHGAREIPELPGTDGPEPGPQQRQQPPPRPQQRQRDASVTCERCGGATRGGNAVRSKKGPGMRRPYECLTGCEGDSQRRDGSYYPYTTWADA